MKKSIISAIIITLFSNLFATTVKIGFITENEVFMSGYSYEYMQNMAFHNNWDFKYVYGDKESLKKKLINGEIDILPGLVDDDLNPALLNSSDYPMGQANYCLYEVSDEFDYLNDNLRSLNGLYVDVDKNSVEYELLRKWTKNNDIKINVSSKVKNNMTIEIDMFANENWIPVARLGNKNIYIGVSKHNPEILRDLNNAQTKLYGYDPNFNNILWNKYYSNSFGYRLTFEETNYLLEKKEINIGCFYNDEPYTSIDKKTGKVSGLISSLMYEAMDYYNLDLKINYIFFEDYEDLLKALRSGEIDFGFPFIYEVHFAEQMGFILSKEITHTNIGYIYNQATSMDNLFNKVAVPKNKRSTEFFYTLPYADNINIVELDSAKSCLDALIRKEVSGAVFNIYQLQTLLYARDKYKSLSVVEIPEAEKLCFALDNKSTLMLSIVNKMLSVIPQTEIQNELVRFSLDAKNYSFYDFFDDYFHIIITTLLIIVVLASGLICSFIYLKLHVNYDSLTGFYNRKCLKMYMQRFYEKAIYENKVFSIMMFDFDSLKNVNRQFGVDTGDAFLKIYAEKIRRMISKKEKAFRLGGEEFFIVLDGDKDYACKFGEKIRKYMENKVLEFHGNKVSLTISAGISTYEPGMMPGNMINIVDEKLSEAKKMGGNKVIC